MEQSFLDEIIQYAIKEKNLSDIHLVNGEYPIARIGGLLVRVKEFPPVYGDTLQEVFDTLVPEREVRERFTNERELDVGFSVGKTARFRINVYRENNGLAFAIRKIPFNPPRIKDINLPPYFKRFIGQESKKEGGIVIIGGATGSGKTTTLAAFVEEINNTMHKIIITLEDPIEYIFKNKKSIISQREIGRHTRDFAIGLKEAKRQDPDVIVVGEIRDSDSVDTALGAAESGHLVFTTIHTDSVFEMPNRVAVNFPAGKQAKILFILSRAIKALITQRLIISSRTNLVYVLPEVLIPDDEDRDLIAQGKFKRLKEKAISSLKNIRTTSYHPKEEHIAWLYRKGLLSENDLYKFGDADILKYYIKRRL